MAARSWSSSVASGPVIFQILYALVSNAALRLFIANAYFFQRQQQDPSSDGRQDLSLCSEFQGCSYILSKLDELMAANAATTEWEDQEETLARLTRSASVMARFCHGKKPEDDLLDLLDVTKILLELVYCWVLLQLGRNKKSIAWLTGLESQALAGTTTTGGQEQVEKLFLFLLANFDHGHRPDRASLARLRQIHDSLSSSLVRIEWKSTNVLPGALQMLEELIAAHDTIGDDHVYGNHGQFAHWFRDHSQSYNRFRRWKRAFYPVDASELLGRLVHTWMRTTRGAMDHARLQSLCCSTSKDFVEHVKQTLESNVEEEKRKLHDAAAVVYGTELSVSFVLLCSAVAWDKSTTSQSLDAEELGSINGKRIIQVDEHPVDTVVKLMVNAVLGDFLNVAHDRETWIRDCKVLLKKRCPIRLPWKPAASVHFLEDVAMERWREMDAWIRSPGTLSELGMASYEQALQAMRNAIFRDGRVVDQASKEFVARIGKLLEAKDEQVYELIEIYIDDRIQKACGTNSGTTTASKKRGRGSMAEFAVVVSPYRLVMGLLSKRQRCHMSDCHLQGGQAITPLDMMKIKVAMLRVKRRLATVHMRYACYHGNKNKS
ncbi:uncharacterized protein LOC9661983 isoform X2 [Selaginella moellendorffii]|uniref:uncharacterized protein LOC9661983 isoform X2 n=1 Tax=Selaginella moellendorffii TaxID=88036 RepID=UPI000D1CF14D|nr:uncharacterized protein LOC9661983 isoform X2 [Selaginella moellendorffii]|eukprot:XP_024514980.1 uncharacterized protein LOC9661983 isoform X2 [Selaginella moellendorffii]